jgi:hypothetical protein
VVASQKMSRSPINRVNRTNKFTQLATDRRKASFYAKRSRSPINRVNRTNKVFVKGEIVKEFAGVSRSPINRVNRTNILKKAKVVANAAHKLVSIPYQSGQ